MSVNFSELFCSTSVKHGILGERIPAVWTHESQGDNDTRALRICSGVNTNADDCHNSNPVRKNQWHSVAVEQKLVDLKYMYSVFTLEPLVSGGRSTMISYRE